MSEAKTKKKKTKQKQTKEHSAADDWSNQAQVGDTGVGANCGDCRQATAGFTTARCRHGEKSIQVTNHFVLRHRFMNA